MFTGIIKKISVVSKAELRSGSLFVDIEKPKGWKIKLGESIAVNGVCSTVRETKGKNFQVEYMPETIKKTTAVNFQKGTKVNLEKSLKADDLLDGHIVQGHVDTKGKIVNITDADQSKIVKIKVPTNFMRLIADKGSVTVDGISLTVVDAGRDWFTVSLVSYTLKNTNLGIIRPGEEVNIETDVLAKYIDKILSAKK